MFLKPASISASNSWPLCAGSIRTPADKAGKPCGHRGLGVSNSESRQYMGGANLEVVVLVVWWWFCGCFLVVSWSAGLLVVLVIVVVERYHCLGTTTAAATTITTTTTTTTSGFRGL